MHPGDKIYIAGHTGLVGSALVKRLRELGYSNLILRKHQELDLTDQREVEAFFDVERPTYVFLAAAKVGGILANFSYPGDFIHENLRIETNIIHASYRYSVERLLFLGSSCIYPRNAPQPLKEELLLNGPLEFTNRPYAIAKIAGIEMCWAYNRQYKTQFLAAMPTNLYGFNDNYDPKNSHLVAALIRKVYEAKILDVEEIIIWGTGTPLREFLYSEDAANACIFLMNLPSQEWGKLVGGVDHPPLINVGCGEEITVRRLAEIIGEVAGVNKRLVFDTAKPDGVPRKLMDVSRLFSLGWRPQITLRQGLQITYTDFAARRTEELSIVQGK